MPRDYANSGLREQVARRAQFRCEYCLYPESRSGFAHQLDHIVSRKHGGESTLENLAFSCILCNRFKGADVAAISEKTGHVVRLYNPRVDRWADHFRINGTAIESLTPEGEATARILRFNQPGRILERQLLQGLGFYLSGS